MTMYRVRSIKPVESKWIAIDYDGTAWEAANQVHCDHDGEGIKSLVTHRLTDDGGYELVKFACMEVEGYGDDGEPISRIFETGIWRKDLRKSEPKLREIAVQLGWERDPDELLADWGGEESYESALERRQDRG